PARLEILRAERNVSEALLAGDESVLAARGVERRGRDREPRDDLEVEPRRLAEADERRGEAVRALLGRADGHVDPRRPRARDHAIDRGRIACLEAHRDEVVGLARDEEEPRPLLVEAVRPRAVRADLATRRADGLDEEVVPRLEIAHLEDEVTEADEVGTRGAVHHKKTSSVA